MAVPQRGKKDLMDETIVTPSEKPQKSHKKVLIILTLITTIMSWVIGFLFIGDAVFGFMTPFKTFIQGLGSWSWIVFSLLFVVITVSLFFVGGIGSAFIQLSVLLFAPSYKAFILSAICIFAASILQYWLGRFIGVRPFKWAIGEKDYDKAVKIAGSPTIIGLALLLPYFPDSLICFLAGASKNKFSTFWIIALITRTFGVAGICFVNASVLSISTWQQAIGSIGLVPTLMIMFSGLVSFILLIVGLFFAGRWLEKTIAKHHQKTETKES